ncbi:MAG: hypothetical protein ABSF84_08190 [Acidimicrobiales bacterium]|jgi:hypothetical protein
MFTKNFPKTLVTPVVMGHDDTQSAGDACLPMVGGDPVGTAPHPGEDL